MNECFMNNYLENKDIIFLIGLQLKLKDLYNYITISKKYESSANSFGFWHARLKKVYGFTYYREKTLFHIKQYYRVIKAYSVIDRYYEAIKIGDVELINKFISKGIEQWNWGLFYATQKHHKNLIDFFIDKGANNWDQCMYAAALENHTDLVDFFIDKGAKNWKFGLLGARRAENQNLIDFFENKKM